MVLASLGSYFGAPQLPSGGGGAPSAGASPSAAGDSEGEGDGVGIGSMQVSQVSVDLLGQCESDSGHSGSDWYHDAYSSTQPSERNRTLRDALEGDHMTYREQAYGAPASSAGRKTSQDLSGT